jgi:hypothetical protein
MKQIALREIHTHPGCEDVSAIGIYPVTGEVAERNLVCEPPPNEWTPVVGSQSQEVSNGKK